MVVARRAPAHAARSPRVPSEKGAGLGVPRTSVRPRVAWADVGSDSEGTGCGEWASESSTLPGSSGHSVELASPTPPDRGDSGSLPGRTRGHVESVGEGDPTRSSVQAYTGQSRSPVVRAHRWRLKNRNVYEHERDGKLGTELGAKAEASSGARPVEGGDWWATTASITEWRAPQGFGLGDASYRHDVQQLEKADESAEPTQPEFDRHPEDGFIVPQGHQDVTDDELAAFRTYIPLGEKGELPSVGSLKHVEGSCKPCAFVYTQIGCKLNVQCEFCHILHRRKDRRRLGKAKRERYRDLISQVVGSKQKHEADKELQTEKGRFNARLTGG